MAELPEDIEAMGCALHQFWVDRVRECMDEGILKAGDPVQMSLTMWAHAHGLVSLFHHGHFRIDQETFRKQFHASSVVMLMGIAAEEFAAELAEEPEWARPAGVQG